MKKRGKPGSKFVAFGEEKTLREWSEDPRCKVSLNTLKRRVLTYKHPIEKAIAEPVCKVGRGGHPARKVSAFGEEKTTKQWVEDSRCKVSLATLNWRLKNGCEPEEAMATEPQFGGETKGHRIGAKIAAFGEEKSIREWSEDSRCKVRLETIRGRLKKGWEPEKAIAEPPYLEVQKEGVAE